MAEQNGPPAGERARATQAEQAMQVAYGERQAHAPRGSVAS